jgi:hypothetical protein
MWNTQFARFGAGHLEAGEPIAMLTQASISPWSI